MKRSVALVLTGVIFAAIAVCFLRPTPDLNPDFGYSFQANPGFGYADKFDGQYQKIELEGNSEYFEETALLYVDPADPCDRIFDRGHSDNANNALAWNGNSRYGFCYPSDVGNERSVSFCYTVPEVTEMTFDVVSANIIWSEETPDRRALRLTLRLNHGTPAPYMRFGGYSPPMHEENGLATYSMSVDSDKSEYTADIHFAENPDGSGKQYDLTLNLRFK